LLRECSFHVYHANREKAGFVDKSAVCTFIYVDGAVR
jgi:hypothetical protein